MGWFRKQVVAIENEAKHFIDDSFKTLRSAEGAFDMLLNFRHIRSREAINSQMMRKFTDILLQYGKEVCQALVSIYLGRVGTLSVNDILCPKEMITFASRCSSQQFILGD